MRIDCRKRGIAPMALAIAMLFCAFSARADDLPPGRFADLTLKILTFDRNLPQRAGNGLTIAIVSSRKNESAARLLVAAFEERRKMTVSGFPFAVQPVSIDDPKAFRSRVNELRPACIITVNPSPDEIKLISALTRELQLISISSNKEHVNPLSLAFVIERNQVKIYRSDVALLAENVAFPPDFLSITRAR